MALNLEVNILGEYKNLTKATKGATKQLQGLQSSVNKISRGVNTALAAIGVGISFSALKSSIQSAVNEASNLEQAYGAAAAVFKDSSGEIIASSKEAAKAYGLSANQYLQSANLIGAQLSNLGFTQAEYTKQTQGLVELGADLAATFGGTAYDAVQALSAVFRGEYNQVERYGVSIRKSDINARLAATGQDKLTGVMLKQAEALAALDILYGQTTAAQGQFERESNTLAGALQILRAGADNAKIAIGEGFYPAVFGVADFINRNIGVFEDLAEAVGTKIKKAFEDSAGSAENFGTKVINTLTQLTEFLNGTAEAGNVFFDLQQNVGPVLELVGAFGEVLKGLISVLNGVFDGLFGWINLFLPAGEQISGLAGFVEFLGKKLQEVGEFIGFIISLFIPFTAGFKIAGGIIKTFGGFVAKTFEALGGIVSKAFKPIGDFFTSIANGIRTIFAPGMVTAQNAVSNFVADVIQKVPFLAPLLKFFTVEIPLALKFFLNLPVVKQVLQVLDYIFGGIRSLVGGGNGGTTAGAGSAEDRRFAALDPRNRPVSTGAEDRRLAALNPNLKITTPPPLTLPGAPKSLTGGGGKSKAELAAEKALEEFKKNVQNLVDTVEDALEDAKQRVRDAATNFRDAVSLSFGIITNGAFAVFDVNRVIRQMRKIKEAAKTFVEDIKALQAGGADQALIDQLLGMDPISGATAARGLLASGRLEEFLQLRRELADIGGGAGEAANVGIYGTSTSNLETALAKLNRLLEGGVSNVYNINIENAANMTARDIIDAIKSYEKTTGKKVFSN